MLESQLFFLNICVKGNTKKQFHKQKVIKLQKLLKYKNLQKCIV